MENGVQITIGKTKDGMTLEKIARECRKFSPIFPEPSTHKL